MNSLFGSLIDSIVSDGEALAAKIAGLPVADQVEALNRIRQALHAAGPFANQPVDCVQWVPIETVRGNDYNPNAVAPPEMRLLERSIDQDGYTQPVVAWQNGNGIEVVDGFHRRRLAGENKRIRARIHGYLPVAMIGTGRTGRNDRMAATIRHNRARGVHGIRPMTDVVAEMIINGWTDAEVARELGMDADELLRFKQNTGLAELFKGHEYSRAWE